MFTVRRSYLEEYRRVVDTEWGDEDNLVRTIMGNPDPVSWQANAGSAWDELLTFVAERSLATGSVPVGRTAPNGEVYLFEPGAVRDALAEIGPGVWKVQGSKVYHTPGGLVRVTGETDHQCGEVVTDVKAKWSAIDPEEYEPSLQWRFYLSIHEARVFRYCCYLFAEPDDVGLCRLKSTASFRFWRYADLERDCAEWAHRFLCWAKGKGIEGYLNSSPEVLGDSQEV